MSMWAFPFVFPLGAAGDDRKKRGEEDGTFCRVACGVACTDAGRDRRGAGEDILSFAGGGCVITTLSEGKKLSDTRLDARRVFDF